MKRGADSQKSSSYIKRPKYAAIGALGRVGLNYAGYAIRKAARKYLHRKKEARDVKTTIRRGIVLNEGNGGQCSYFNYGSRSKAPMNKILKQSLPLQIIQANVAYQYKSGGGVQSVASDLYLVAPAITFALTADDTSCSYIESARGKYTIENVMVCNCSITIYDCVARKDVALAAISTPAAAWNQGDVDTTGHGSHVDQNRIGSTPFQSEAFNQYWKVLQTTDVVLGPGAQHQHIASSRPEKVFSGAYSTYTPYGFKDETVFTMIVLRGSPSNDSVTQTQVTLGAATINVIVEYEHRLRQMMKQTPTITCSNTLITAFSVSEQAYNQGSGATTTNTEF